MKCNELMIWDWCCNEHGTPMQIINVGTDAYATCEPSGRAYAFSDVEGFNPQPIEITSDILKKNGWEERSYDLPAVLKQTICVKDANGKHLIYGHGLSIWLDYDKYDGAYADIIVPVKYVHQLQQVLRLAGLTELANNFKI